MLGELLALHIGKVYEAEIAYLIKKIKDEKKKLKEIKPALTKTDGEKDV